MSLHFAPRMARLTVTGTGWSNTAIDSGGGFTVDGQLWKDVADGLDYRSGEEVDWDLISSTEQPQIDWTQIIYEDENGNIYTDEDGDGIWRNPESKTEHPENAKLLLPEEILWEMSDSLTKIAEEDGKLLQYNIEADVIPTLYGGKVTTETHPIYTSDDRPHTYAPACWYIQTNDTTAVIFLDEPFYHARANGGSVEVYDEAFSTRDGSRKAIYYSTCNTLFTETYLPNPYSSYPIVYVCWQCVYGSLERYLIGTKDTTASTEDIKEDKSGLEKKIYNGKTYYVIPSKE